MNFNVAMAHNLDTGIILSIRIALLSFIGDRLYFIFYINLLHNDLMPFIHFTVGLRANFTDTLSLLQYATDELNCKLKLKELFHQTGCPH